jgi:autoinducer 2-degrading protein
VIARWKAHAGEEETVERIVRELAAASLEEPGCREYRVSRSVEEERTFVLYEEYDDAAAFQAHRDSEHFRRLALEDGIPRLENRGVEILDSLL